MYFMQISTFIIVKNEAENLILSLPKLYWCKDIVLVDDMSTDDTIEIAKKYNATIYNKKMDGFGAQKQYAASKTQNKWVLNLDADEILSDKLIEELKNLDLNNNISGYEIARRHVFLGKIFMYGKESKAYHLRLFNKENGNFNDAKIHEKVILKGNTLKLKHEILHYSYRNLNQYFEKFNTYTTKGALKLNSKGKTRSLLFIFLSFPFYFFKHYIIYRNFMNGKIGFIWSSLNAWYHLIKYLKLWELNRKKYKN